MAAYFIRDAMLSFSPGNIFVDVPYSDLGKIRQQYDTPRRHLRAFLTTHMWQISRQNSKFMEIWTCQNSKELAKVFYFISFLLRWKVYGKWYLFAIIYVLF